MRFIFFEIFATGVRAFESFRNSACRAFVHGTRLVFLAINISKKGAAFYHTQSTRRYRDKSRAVSIGDPQNDAFDPKRT